MIGAALLVVIAAILFFATRNKNPEFLGQKQGTKVAKTILDAVIAGQTKEVYRLTEQGFSDTASSWTPGIANELFQFGDSYDVKLTSYKREGPISLNGASGPSCETMEFIVAGDKGSYDFRIVRIGNAAMEGSEFHGPILMVSFRLPMEDWRDMRHSATQSPGMPAQPM